MLWLPALLAVLLSAGTALPAAANTGDNVRKKDSRKLAMIERGEGRRLDRRRIARASIADDNESYEASHRYVTDDEDAPRYTKRRSSRHVARRHHRHRVAHRARHRVVHHGARHRVAHHRRVRGPRVAAYHRHPAASHLGGSSLSGVASYYYSGTRVASGARFNPDGLTAAHRTLPFGTRVRVTHLGNGRSVNVTINDRGPFIGGRIIDLSRGAANVIGMMGQGLARVSVTILGR
jgi:rare lipoprotein A